MFVVFFSLLIVSLVQGTHQCCMKMIEHIEVVDRDTGRSRPMYARLVTSQLHPGTVDEAVQIFRDSVVPDARQQPGFQGAMALVDRSANKTISITLWQTEARASATVGHLQAQMNKFASHLTVPPVVETFEVAVQE